MATFIERPEDEDEEFAELPETEESIEPEQPEEETAEATESVEEDDIPDKYRGKTAAEIAKMHEEAEKLIGRQSSEVGELRRIVDDFVKTQLEQQKQSPQAQDEPEIDFFEDPDAYIERKLASHPKMKEAEEYNQQARQSAILTQLQQNHPDYQSILQDEKFAEWIMASKVRQNLYAQADQQFDYDAADELLTLWKERQNIVKQTEEVQKQDRKNQAKAASTGKAKGSGEPSSRKVYRRSDIIELMKTNPKRYAQISDEIMQAYAEGRVK
jgi:hypothetical protein